MLFVKKLSEPEKLMLDEMLKNHPTHAPRKRAHCVLLSATGFRVGELVNIFGSCRQTVASWLNSWETSGVCGLLDAPRCGRPRKITTDIEAQVVDMVKDSPRMLKPVLAQLFECFGIKVSCATLKRLCKRVGLCWKRVRRSLKFKQNPELFAKSKQQLAELIEQARQELIDLYYFDQSGFSLEPCVPYAWQPIGETIKLPCSRSKRLNVLGFMSRNCEFESFVFEGGITSKVVVECIDHFALKLKRATTLVIDNAPIHTSLEFEQNLEKWRAQGLTIVRIAPYSPELNLIEILWRKIKYEWLPFSAYTSFHSLRENLFDILANIGQSYRINFS